MRKTSIGIAASALMLATMGSTLLTGTALAGTAAGAHGTAPAAATNNCYTIKNGKIVLDPSGCKSSSTSSNGSSSSSNGNSGSSNGTSTPGKATNNCVPASSCTSSATGTGGKGH